MKNNKAKVLIIDDEEEIGILLISVLGSIGFKAEHKLSLHSGLSAFELNNYDIVFLDLRLPDGEGISIIPRIREKNADANIIMISAHGGQQDIERAFGMGVNSYLQKPFNMEQIKSALKGSPDNPKAGATTMH